ncbi:MAG TPA: hemerythrin domain-containing protein [Anaerolineae bacterium]|nr:hemerythrin domain-containing protein [Anaerolineae bacterium]
MTIAIPQPLQVEHEELHNELKQAIAAGGKVGEAATAVAMALHPHFGSEEEYALPPLGLLPALAEGIVTPEMADVLPLTDKLKAELPHMLEEHQAIVAALKKLQEAAQEENKPEYAHFAEKLMLHARMEEEVSYPTTILIGEYLRLRLGK